MTGMLMTGGVANMLINAIIIVLLAVTIGYCWLLNRRIKILQDSRSELALLLKHFDESTQRASDSIIALQTASRKIGENIQHRIDKANYLIDDLNYMIEKGNKIANQMEAGFAVGRAQRKVESQEPPRTRIEPKPEPKVEPEVAEAEETKMTLKPFPTTKPFTQAFPQEKPAAPESRAERQPSVREKTSASLEAVLERVVGRNKELADDEPPRAAARPQRPMQAPAQPSARVRSRSEQELLDLIKAGMKG